MKRPLFLFALLALGLTGLAHGQAISKEQLSRRALVWVKSSKWSDTPLRKRKISCNTLARYKSLLYVECLGMTGPGLLRSLAAIPGVRGVARDREMYPVQHALPHQPFAPKGVGTTGLDQTGFCRLSETCPDGRSKFWGQERLDADLMFGQLNRIQLGKGHTKVAVIDSGFDMAQARTLMDESLVSVSKGWDGAGDPNRDEIGHGTAVAGLIGGKDGVGLAPDARLSIYRVSEDQSSGSATSSSLMMSVMKACDEGNEIINLSWGGVFDENAIFEDEQSNKQFYDELAAKGCLVVKSAGNSARRIDRKHMNLDDALLRVEATEAAGQLASFSSNGEVSAPGAEVFSLHSSQSPAASAESTCGGHKGAFISGTSFAAPFTAAIATQTLGVLKKNPDFLKLPGPERVKTLNRVLAAANVNGGLNGLRAVLIADMLRVTPSSFPVPSFEQINEKFKNRAATYCATPRPLCSQSAKSCKDERDCAAQSREHLAICAPPRAEVVKDLLRIADKTRSIELGMSLLRQEHVFTPDEAASQTKKFWAQLNSQWMIAGKGNVSKGMAFYPALQLLPVMTSSRSRSGINSNADVALGNFLTSTQFKKRLSRDLKSDSQTDLERVMVAMQNAYESMGAANFLSLVKDSARKNIVPESADQPIPAAGFISTSRLFDAMISNPKFGPIKEELLKLERAMAVFAQDKGLSEAPKEKSYFKPLYSRNADLLATHAQSMTAPNAKVDLASLPLLHLLENPSLMPEDQRIDFNIRVVDAYGKHLTDPKVILGASGSFAAKKAIENLQDETKSLSDVERKKVRDAYWKRFEGASSIKQRLAAFPNSTPLFFSFEYTSLTESTLFKGDILHEQSEKIARQIVESPTEWTQLGHSRTSALYSTLPFLVRKESSKPLIPQLGLRMIETLMTGVSSSKGPKSVELDTQTSIEAFQYLFNNDVALETLKADPNFVASVKRLKSDLSNRASLYTKHRSALNTVIAKFEKTGQ